MKNLLSCCPCGRPNPIGCIAETVTNVVNLVTCPLDGMMNFQMDNFLRSLKAYIHQLVFGNFPTINIEISLPVAHFEISLPKFVQDCLGKSSFTKFCSLLDKPLKITFGSLIAAENVKQPSFAERGVSLSNQIKASCMGALGEFKKFGKKMSTCFDSPDDFFFLIPPVGFIAALTCDPNYSDPDPGINYCPCEVPDLTQEKEKQPYCVIWHRSWHRTCASLCRDKKYVPGKKPSGGTGKMHKTFGYPRCEKLEYYCRKSNINIKNGQASCSSDYTIYGSTCRITPNPGYICPVTVIECGSEGDPSKGVCWNYRFIKCAMNDKRHFPMCTCPNKNTFQKGEVVCQSGSANGIALKNVLEMRRSVSCFKPLGLEGDILKECGPSTNPCVVQQPNVEAYQRCGLTKVQKFWEKYGKELLGGGIVAILVAVALLVGLCKAYASDNIDTSCSFLSIMIIAILVFLTAGIVMLVFKSKFRTYEDDDDNYLTMGEALF
ncbi:hypothetical protein QZH41_007391 [Actinostola sp. cb2023]|nr:hypothetical protein QZH41_007391 [Actinostola sp. cb2023]